MHDYKFIDLIAKLSTHHRQELEWFLDNKGALISWKDIPNRNLAKNPKGIYCPAGEEYCLAVKNIIDSQYSEEESLVYINASGSFYFEYPPEDHEKGMKYFTNSKLKMNANCLIPIGLIYQKTKKPNPQYLVYGPALVRYHEKINIFQLYGFSKSGKVRFL